MLFLLHLEWNVSTLRRKRKRERGREEGGRKRARETERKEGRKERKGKKEEKRKEKKKRERPRVWHSVFPPDLPELLKPVVDQGQGSGSIMKPTERLLFIIPTCQQMSTASDKIRLPEKKNLWLKS